MNVLNNYEILSILGEGTFGIVKLVQDKKTKEKVAIKILEKKKIKTEEDKRRVQTEIEILQKMSHINVIKAKKILKDSENIYIMMEYCEKGELFHYIEKEICLSNDEAACYFYQLINGLEYIHQKGIVHRDLKLENILLSKTNLLKIIDFGLSSYYDSNKLLSTPCGSLCYASPELLSGQKYDGILIDIWSVGVILYAMLCGYLPFDDENHGMLYKRIINTELDIPEHLEEDSVDMLRKILVNEPKKRITIKEIKKHKFYIKGKKEFIRSHPNIVKLINKKITNLQKERSKKIRIIKNRNKNDETDNINYNKKENIINNDDIHTNTIKINEKNSIKEEKYANDKIANIFKEELMKKILKRKIKINFDSLLINSINLNINNDNNQKSQKDSESIFNKNNTSIKIDYNKDIKPYILKTISFTRNQEENEQKDKLNKTFNEKDRNNDNNNILNISHLTPNKNLLTNRSTEEKENNKFNKFIKNKDEKIQNISFITIKNNNNPNLSEKKKKILTIKNIKTINNKTEIDSPTKKIMSITPRFERANVNLTKEKNNNSSYRQTISVYDIRNKQKNNILNTNDFNPKQYHKKVIKKDGNLYLNLNSMKDFDVTKVINNDNFYKRDNYTLSFFPNNKNKNTHEIKLKKNIDYLKYKSKLNNKNQSNYKDNLEIREPKSDSNEELNTLSNNNKFIEFNNNIIYKRIFNYNLKPNNTNKNDIMNTYNKKNINEKKSELKGFKNKERTDYILTDNNNGSNTNNYNINEKFKLINDTKREIISSKLVNLSKNKKSKNINKMNHYVYLTNKNNSTKIKQLYDIKLDPKKYKYNLSINRNKSKFQNDNEQNYKKELKINMFNNKNVNLNNNEKNKNNLDKNKLLSKINNNNFFNLINNINKSLDDINYNSNNDKITGNYQGYYYLKTDFN